MKEEPELEFERQRGKQLDACKISPLVCENLKRKMSLFMPSFNNILTNSSSDRSATQGAPFSASTHVSIATF
jgi:hypothetical protein